MKKKVVIRKYAFILSVLMILSVFMLSSCGVPEYNTVHESGTYVVRSYDDFERLAFSYKTSVNEVSKVIPNFCIYGESNYTASVPLDMKNWKATHEEYDSVINDAHLFIHFNGDKEFTDFVIKFGDGYDRAAFMGKIIYSGETLFGKYKYSRGETDGMGYYNFVNGRLKWDGSKQIYVNQVTYLPN